MQYNHQLFNIYSQVQDELDDFFKESIKISGTKNDNNVGYDFSQKDTLNLINFVGASKFEKGDKDTNGNQKIYLNSSTFRADVASKQIDIDLKDILLVPDDYNDKYKTLLVRKMFKNFAKDTGFSVDLNEMVELFPFYGSLVVKKIKKDFEIVPLSILRNQQDAKSLNTASYVILEHNMKVWEAQQMPNWDLSGMELEWDSDITVYERYGRVPAKFFDAEADETESVDTVSFIVLDAKKKKTDVGGCMLFIEKLTKRPFKEVHWKRRHGRWLGVGEIENNFENQKARNLVTNLRLRSLQWSSKQIFQTQDEEVVNNLVKDIKDGDVLLVSGAGGITPVNNQTKALADYQAFDTLIEDNSNQKSFTFEVATGEEMKSGTPFRLAVVLSNAVNSHFNLKREKLSLFLKEILYEFVFPNFEQDTFDRMKEYMAEGEDGYNDLIDIVANIKTNEFIKQSALIQGKLPTKEEVIAFMDKVKARGFAEFKLPKGFAKSLKYAVDIVVSGETVDVEKKIETLTNLYTALSQAQDPRAEKILEKIIVLAGEDMPKANQTMQQLAPQLGAINQQANNVEPNQPNPTA